MENQFESEKELHPVAADRQPLGPEQNEELDDMPLEEEFDDEFEDEESDGEELDEEEGDEA